MVLLCTELESGGVRVVCANAGDARGVACFAGSSEAVRMSVDHTPGESGERRRLRLANGFVEFGRLDGSLAVSRALGDYSFERSGLVATPHVFDSSSQASRLSGGLRLAVLASDGLWDVVSDQDALDHAARTLREGGSPAKAASLLARLARDRLSSDDISVVVVAAAGVE